MSDRRVALVLDHAAQQFAPAFSALAASSPGSRAIYRRDHRSGYFDVRFGREVAWDVDLFAGYPTTVLPDPPWRALRTLARTLRADRPDVVITFGWGARICQATIVLCVALRIPVLLYGDTTWQHPPRLTRRLIRWLVLHILFRIVDGAIATGTFNRDFYIGQGMDPAHLHPGVCPVDVPTFAAARRVRSPGTVRIGFAGKLIELKGVDELLEAVALLDGRDDWHLALAGDGAERERLRQRASVLGLDDRVTFEGFLNTSAMPAFLAGCDVVVVPSRFDRRVLVVTEAMAAGAAVIVSTGTAVWGPGDLVEDGVSGLVYRRGSAHDLAHALTRLLDDAAFRVQLQEAGQRRAAHQGPETFARTVLQAAEAIAR